MDAISTGTTEGLKLAANVGAMLLVFVAFIAMINGILGWVGDITTLNDIIAASTPYRHFVIRVCAWLSFCTSDVAYRRCSEDMALMGQLLGIKIAASEFIGYIQLANLKDASNAASPS